MYLDHLSKHGSAESMPEVAFPELELGYTYSHGRSKCNIQYAVVLKIKDT